MEDSAARTSKRSRKIKSIRVAERGEKEESSFLKSEESDQDASLDVPQTTEPAKKSRKVVRAWRLYLAGVHNDVLP